MSKTRTREVGTFNARTANERRVVVHIVATETEAGTLQDVRDHWIETSRGYWLADRTPVNADDAGRLTNARTGEALTRL